MKKYFSLLIISLSLVKCMKKDDLISSTNVKGKILAVHWNTDENNRLVSNDIVEIDLNNGNPTNIYLVIKPKQASLDYNFSYLNTSNELLVIHGNKLNKIEINSKAVKTLDSDVFGNMTTDNHGNLYGLKRSSNDHYRSDLTIELVKINTDTGKILSVIESFKTLENHPTNNRTGVEYMFYSIDTNELIIPQRIFSSSKTIDNLIRINLNDFTKTIISTDTHNYYIAGPNGRIFAQQNVSSQSNNFSGGIQIVEIDPNNGEEIQIISSFENSSNFKDEIFFLYETNEIILNNGYNKIYKTNINTKETITITTDKEYRTFRGITINK